MPSVSTYDFIKIKIASMEYAPGKHFSEMDIAKELGIPRRKVREAFSLLEQDNLVQIFPQRCTTICKLELTNILDSIFIVRSILIAIIKDLDLHQTDIKKTIVQAKEHLVTIDSDVKFSDLDFFKADNHFYSTLTGLNGFPRLNQIIFNAKLNIDRTLRLSIGRRADYIAISKLYDRVLDGLIEDAADKSIKAICELSSLLENHANIAVKVHPSLFK